MSAQHNMTLADIKAALRAGPYAWPGGYPMYFLASDMEPLSFESVQENWRQIVSAHLTGCNADWLMAGVEVNWEDADLYCTHSGERIPSAYAEPEEEEEA